MHVIQVSEERVLTSHPAADNGQGIMNAQTEKKGHQRVSRR